MMEAMKDITHASYHGVSARFYLNMGFGGRGKVQSAA